MKDLEHEIREYLVERGWDTLRPADIAKSISIEAAELLEIFQWSSQSLDEVRADTQKLEKIQKELADVLIYCLDMSVLLNLDTSLIIREKLQKVREKYPPELLASQKDVGGAEFDSVYWKIKKEHREITE